jgi:hypothetical protein
MKQQAPRAVESCKAGRHARVRWKRLDILVARLDDPIPLPRARHLVKLNCAAKYIQKRPKAEQLLDEWRAAAVLLVVELNGPTMMAHRRALKQPRRADAQPDRKDNHWGKRKIKAGRMS